MSLNHNILSKIESKMVSDIYKFTSYTYDSGKEECFKCSSSLGEERIKYVSPPNKEELVNFLIKEFSNCEYNNEIFNEIIEDMYQFEDKIPKNVPYRSIKKYLVNISDLCMYISSITMSYKIQDCFGEYDKKEGQITLVLLKPEVVEEPDIIKDNSYHLYI